jgi:hypothetical protein
MNILSHYKRQKKSSIQIMTRDVIRLMILDEKTNFSMRHEKFDILLNQITESKRNQHVMQKKRKLFEKTVDVIPEQ